MNAMELEGRHSAHNYEPLPVVLARGQGAHLWDIAGRRYIDMMSAYSAASHGHAHPRILAALTAQAERLAVPSRAYYNDRLGPFLAELTRISGLDAALPINTGAEAVETAIKAARRWGHFVKGIPRDRAETIAKCSQLLPPGPRRAANTVQENQGYRTRVARGFIGEASVPRYHWRWLRHATSFCSARRC